MKILRVYTLFCVVAGVATTASAQMGLYGSPDSLQLTPAQAPTDLQPLPARPAPMYQTVADVQPVAPAPRPPRVVGPQSPSDANWQPAIEPIPNPAVSGPSVVNQMLGEPNAQPVYPATGNCGGNSGCDNPPACGDCNACACSPWYVSLYALSMTRDQPNKLWTTYEWGNMPNQLMNTQDIDFDWRWGGEVRIGRNFCCNQWAIEADYWTLDPFQGTASMTNPNGVGTPLAVGDVLFNGSGANNWFDNAAEHRLWRNDEFHNLELNLIRNRLCGGCGPLDVDFLVGFRFFRFRDSLTFGTLEGGYTWGQDGGAHEAYLNEDITNNLFGLQLGFNGHYYLSQCLSLFVTPKFGIYDNNMQNDFGANLGDGTGATQTAYPTMGYPVHSSRNSVAFLAQIDLGVNWKISQCWEAQIGYRVLAATGVGLADNQIPHYVVDIPAIADIDRNGSLVMHGAFVGATYRF